jgi:hypothetical protein
MTASTVVPVRQRTPLISGAVPRSGLRMLWIELRRNAMPWILPLVAALFWFDSYRPSTGASPLYGFRTFWNMGEGHTIVDVGPLTAGVAAWMGSRNGRRGMIDLMTVTARPRWAAQLATWAATSIWAVAAYLILVAAMFAAYAHQGVGGTPPWWYVAVGATAVAAFSAAGFAIGAYWPSRFAAPVGAFGGFLALVASARDSGGWSLVLPTNYRGNFDGSAQNDAGIYSHWLADLPLARIMSLAGITIAILGLIGLPSRSGGGRLRAAAAIVTLAGVAAAGTGAALASTGKFTAQGVVIPALHDAANDVPIGYTPVCDRTAGIPTCLNPAFRRWLPDVTSALAPMLAEVADLPGSPQRATQVAAAYPSGGDGPPQPLTIIGQPPTLRMSLGLLNMPGPCGFCDGPVSTTQFAGQLRLLFAHTFVGAGVATATLAQQAVQAALLQRAGVPLDAQNDVTAKTPNSGGTGPGTAGSAIYEAARRLSALPTAALHSWLATHLAALRDGRLALRDLP